jgi:hypothetical protein
MSQPISSSLQSVIDNLSFLPNEHGGIYQLESWVIARWQPWNIVDISEDSDNDRVRFYIEYSALMGGNPVLQTAASIASFSGVLGYWGLVGNALAATWLGADYPQEGVEFFSQHIAADQLALIGTEVNLNHGGFTTTQQNAEAAVRRSLPRGDRHGGKRDTCQARTNVRRSSLRKIV